MDELIHVYLDEDEYGLTYFVWEFENKHHRLGIMEHEFHPIDIDRLEMQIHNVTGWDHPYKQCYGHQLKDSE